MNNLGRNIKYNECKYAGYLGSYKKKHYAYNPSEKKVVVFNKRPTFQATICEDTVTYYDSLKGALPKKGQLFIGNDGQEYYNLGVKNLKIEMALKDSDSEFESDIFFIKEKLEEVNDILKNIYKATTVEAEFLSMSTEEKIRTGLTSFLENFNGFAKVEILEIGPILKGMAHFHEIETKNAYYLVTGLVVKFRSKLLEDITLIDDHSEVGIFGIKYDSKANNYAPISFMESNSDDVNKAFMFYSGCGDDFEVHKTLIDSETINKEIKKIDLSYYEV